VKDFASLTGRFELDLPDPLDSAKAPTAEIIARYSASIATGDPISRVYCSITPIIFLSRVRGPARFRQTCKDDGARM
jgi:hypothetical protein